MKPRAKDLEAKADEILAQDIREHGNVAHILLGRRLRRREEREVYSTTGKIEDIVDHQREPGVFHRVRSRIQKKPKRLHHE